jgi:hypothetical protein
VLRWIKGDRPPSAGPGAASTRWAPLATAGLLASVALTGCAGPQDDSVEAAAARFAAALAAEDGSAACRLLAPRTKSELEAAAGAPCRDSVVEEMRGQPGSADGSGVEVFGTAARVGNGRDTMFLARFQGGWKVSAAGAPRLRPVSTTVS